MITQHWLTAIRSALATICLMAGPAPAEPLNAAPLKAAKLIRISVIIDQTRLGATLDDTTAGRDFAAMLPLTLRLADYNKTEKVADLPRRLATTGAPS